MLAALGVIAFPWLYAAFPALRYRGYGLARAVGLLLWAYLAWILASLAHPAVHAPDCCGGCSSCWPSRRR